MYNFVGTVAEKYGIDAAIELAAFETEQLAAVEELVERENIACDLQVSQAHDVQLDEKHDIKLKRAYDALIAAGSAPTKTAVHTSGEEAERVSCISHCCWCRAHTFQVSGVKGAKGCFSYRAGRLWPYKLIVGLLKTVIARGANLQANTPVDSMSESPDAEGRWTVNTARGSIKAKHIVLSSNAYTGAIAPEYEGKIVPVRGICSRTVVPNPPNPPLPTLDSSYTVRLKEGIYEYIIARPDGSIVIGGARSVYAHDLNNWYNNTDDSRLIEVAAHHFDGYMQRYFHGWENTGAYTDRVWTGSTYPNWY